MGEGIVGALAGLILAAQPLAAADVEQQVLAAVNKTRVQHGCPALVMNEKLTAAAYGHAKAMAEKNFFGHDSKNGAHFTSRIKAQGYAYADAAENIGMGYSSAQKIYDSWMGSSGHRKNILDCGLTETGIAMYYQADDKPLPGRDFTAKYYWVEVFARPK